jgi:hydrogenase/urease accessory protein HupE
MSRWSARLLVACLLVGVPGVVGAHGLRLAFLEVREGEPHQWHLAAKIPVLGERQWPLELDLPPGCDTVDAVPRYALPSGDLAELRTVRCDPAVAGSAPAIGVRGLEAGLVDLLVRIERADGATVRVLTAADPVLRLAGDRAGGLLPRFMLGVEHILTGYDHLAFVAGILLLVGRIKRVVVAVTAFTVAHSLTLTLSVLDVVRLPDEPVEAVIALSIVYLALEIVIRARGEAPPLSMRRIWLVAFGFGLLHGFGFAGALRETGLPADDLPLTLALFNLGIEAGQIAFVVALAALLWLLRRPLPGRVEAWRWQGAGLDRVCAYGLGAMASFWTIERVAPMVL